MDHQAKVVISIVDGRLEFAGSQEFVEKQLAAFSDFIRESMQRVAKKPAHVKSADPDGKPDVDGGGLSVYENVFAVADGKIQVLKTIPGTTTAQKMVNAARLLALGNALINKPVTTFQEIRDLCAAHGCLDGDNFSTTVKKEKSEFVFGGGPKSQSLSLSVPGRKSVEKFAAELNKAEAE
jgi:hypothetical protein